MSCYLPQLKLPDDVASRWGHSVTAISLTPGLTEVTVFGGARLFVPNLPARDIQTIAATTILTFGEL